MSFAKPESCRACLGWSWGQDGFMPAHSGTGVNGVLLVGEALGEDEAKQGKPFVGRAGWQLNSMLQRAGLGRDDFAIANVLSCRPPNNKLSGELYELDVIAACLPNFMRAIEAVKPKCIVALGKTAMNALLPIPFDKASLDDRRGYVEWSQKAQCWVIPTCHPSFIMRGNQKLTGVWLNDIQHALAIARDGHQPHQCVVLGDPTPMEFFQWILGYEAQLASDPTTLLAYDIETLGKQSTKEDELDLGDQSYTITRIGFCYRPGEALSVPWSAEHMPHILRLMASSGVKIAHNQNYDRPRLLAARVVMGGLLRDSMWAWHVANSDLEKGLGFVATFCCWDQPRWKHLGQVNPAFYNGTDAEVCLRIMLAMEQDLRQLGLWDVYLRHICKLDQYLLWPMTKAGVLLDDAARQRASLELQNKLKVIQAEMASAVPPEAQRMKVYKSRPPKGVQLEEVAGERKAKVCSRCGLLGATKPHVTQKTVGTHTRSLLEGVQGPQERIRVPNPCLGAQIEVCVVPVTFWGLREPFVPSNVQLQTYQKVVGHRPQLSKERKPTFDDEAIQKLCKKYPKDKLYPLVSQHSNVSKILSSYIGVYCE